MGVLEDILRTVNSGHAWAPLADTARPLGHSDSLFDPANIQVADKLAPVSIPFSRCIELFRDRSSTERFLTYVVPIDRIADQETSAEELVWNGTFKPSHASFLQRLLALSHGLEPDAASPLRNVSIKYQSGINGDKFTLEFKTPRWDEAGTGYRTTRLHYKHPLTETEFFALVPYALASGEMKYRLHLTNEPRFPAEVECIFGAMIDGQTSHSNVQAVTAVRVQVNPVDSDGVWELLEGASPLGFLNGARQIDSFYDRETYGAYTTDRGSTPDDYLSKWRRPLAGEQPIMLLLRSN